MGRSRPGRSSAASPLHPLQQRPKRGGFQRRASGEHIDHELPARPFERDQEMPREIDAMRAPAGSLRRVQPKDAERDGQAPPPVPARGSGWRCPGRHRSRYRRSGRNGRAARRPARRGAFEVAGIGLGICRRGLHRGAGDGRQPCHRRLPVGLGYVDARASCSATAAMSISASGQAPGGVEGEPGLILAGQGHGRSVAATAPPFKL
jgi:hypothetical protein